mmetsp:Transcript_22685/g.39847  ORF Transcript_22685/g.39847 Transcript_22685/m.39847 type:complete len:531 (+) Transcript_22685:47-1639(+)
MHHAITTAAIPTSATMDEQNDMNTGRSELLFNPATPEEKEDLHKGKANLLYLEEVCFDDVGKLVSLMEKSESSEEMKCLLLNILSSNKSEQLKARLLESDGTSGTDSTTADPEQSSTTNKEETSKKESPPGKFVFTVDLDSNEDKSSTGDADEQKAKNSSTRGERTRRSRTPTGSRSSAKGRRSPHCSSRSARSPRRARKESIKLEKVEDNNKNEGDTKSSLSSSDHRPTESSGTRRRQARDLTAGASSGRAPKRTSSVRRRHANRGGSAEAPLRNASWQPNQQKKQQQHRRSNSNDIEMLSRVKSFRNQKTNTDKEPSGKVDGLSASLHTTKSRRRYGSHENLKQGLSVSLHGSQQPPGSSLSADKLNAFGASNDESGNQPISVESKTSTKNETWETSSLDGLVNQKMPSANDRKSNMFGDDLLVDHSDDVEASGVPDEKCMQFHPNGAAVEVAVRKGKTGISGFLDFGTATQQEPAKEKKGIYHRFFKRQSSKEKLLSKAKKSSDLYENDSDVESVSSRSSFGSDTDL